MAEEQEKIASSKTAGDPTTSQQIALTNAENAVKAAQASATSDVTRAQEAQSAAQAKLTALQKTGGASTNANVQALQALGLTVYNAQGKFVGMGSVIGQLQPKLKDMTQQQQLQALGSIFGTSANKALLDTVLAGPKAWDRAQRAVEQHNAAEDAAAKQNQALGRQLEIMKTQVEDLGTKFGLALIPKLEDAGKALMDVVGFFEHNKAAAIALGVAVGGPLAAAMAVFAVGTVGKVVKAVKGLASNTAHLGQVFKNSAGSAEESTVSSDELHASFTKLSGALESLEGKLTAVGSGFSDINDLEQVQAESVASITAANTAMAESFAAVEEAQGTLSAGFAELGAAEEEFAATSEVTGEASSAAFGPIGIAIMGLVTVGELVVTHWKTISRDIVRGWNDVFGFAKKIFGDLEDFFKKWGEDILIAFAPVVGLPLFPGHPLA